MPVTVGAALAFLRSFNAFAVKQVARLLIDSASLVSMTLSQVSLSTAIKRLRRTMEDRNRNRLKRRDLQKGNHLVGDA